MFDHVTIQVADAAVSREFYAQLLAPLGIRPGATDGDGIGFFGSGPGGFWIVPAMGVEAREIHIAFGASDRSCVEAFLRAGVACGADVIHEARVFPQYHEHYFAAFVRDPDGHSIEAVCHRPV